MYFNSGFRIKTFPLPYTIIVHKCYSVFEVGWNKNELKTVFSMRIKEIKQKIAFIIEDDKVELTYLDITAKIQ